MAHPLVLRSYLKNILGRARLQPCRPKPRTVLLRSQNPYIARGRAQFQSRTATIQISLSLNGLRSPVSAFAGNVNVTEIRMDVVAVGHVNAGANGEADVGSDVDGDIAGGRF